MTKITAYGALATAQADDVLPVVDVHDTSMAATGTTKKITVGALTAQTVSGFTAFGTGGMINTLNSSSGGSVAMVAGTVYWAAVPVLWNVTLTGVIFCTGSAGGTDNWIGALYNSAGTLLANSALAGIAAPAPATKKAFPFTAPLPVTGPAVYYIALQSSGTTAKFLGFNNAIEGFVTGNVTGAFGTLPSITPGTTYGVNLGPFANTY
jgi:hypothetical protein